MRYPILSSAMLAIALLAGFATAAHSQTSTQLGGIATMQLSGPSPIITFPLPHQLPLTSLLEGISSAPVLQPSFAIEAPAEAVTP